MNFLREKKIKDHFTNLEADEKRTASKQNNQKRKMDLIAESYVNEHKESGKSQSPNPRGEQQALKEFGNDCAEDNKSNDSDEEYQAPRKRLDVGLSMDTPSQSLVTDKPEPGVVRKRVIKAESKVAKFESNLMQSTSIDTIREFLLKYEPTFLE